MDAVSDATDSRRSAAVPVRALFDQRISGDDALLRLAKLRFAQAGLAAETYADNPDRLEWLLAFVPPHQRLPVVHLNRNVNLLSDGGCAVVEDFARRFTGRVWGFVVHNKSEMAAQTDQLIARMRDLGSRLQGRPYLFLEYAAGHDPGWFVDVGEQLRDVERVSLCIDVGHVSIRQARHNFLQSHPGLDLATLTPHDPRLPELIDDVESAVRTALPTVLEVTRPLGRIGKALHFRDSCSSGGDSGVWVLI